RGHAELARDLAGDAPGLREHIDEVLKAADRASGVVDRILRFSRRRPEGRRRFEVRPVLEGVVQMLRASIPATIELRGDLAPDCGVVLGSPVDLEQVLINLCTNSYQAMAGRSGWIDVRARRRTKDGREWLELRVLD